MFAIAQRNNREALAVTLSIDRISCCNFSVVAIATMLHRLKLHHCFTKYYYFYNKSNENLIKNSFNLDCIVNYFIYVHVYNHM